MDFKNIGIGAMTDEIQQLVLMGDIEALRDVVANKLEYRLLKNGITLPRVIRREIKGALADLELYLLTLKNNRMENEKFITPADVDKWASQKEEDYKPSLPEPKTEEEKQIVKWANQFNDNKK